MERTVAALRKALLPSVQRPGPLIITAGRGPPAGRSAQAASAATAFLTRHTSTACVVGPRPVTNSAPRAVMTTAPLEQEASHEPNGMRNPNATITKHLTEYMKYLRQHGANVFRIIACRNAIAILERQSTPVRSGAQAEKLTGIGCKIAKKIDEIICTGKLSALAPERLHAIGELKRVSGISHEQAEEYVDAGVRSLAELALHESKLSERQKLGLNFVSEFSQSLPAEEAKQIEGVLRKTGEEYDKKLGIYAIGPYRQGESLTGRGELAFLLVHPGYTNEEAAKFVGFGNPMLKSFIDKLEAKKLIIEAFPPEEADTYHVTMKLPGFDFRRIVTLKGCTAEQSPMALLCMTQSPEFECRLIKRASEKGLTWKKYELYLDDAEHVIGTDGKKAEKRKSRSAKGGIKEKVPVQSQEDILGLLGLQLARPVNKSYS